jgi:hypothetical protein
MGTVRNSSGWYGNQYIPCPEPTSHGQPTAVVGRVLGGGTAEVLPEWQEMTVRFQNATLFSHNLWLNFTTEAKLGTRIYLDGVTLTNESAVA